MDDQVLIVNPGSSSLKLRIVGSGDEVLAASDGPAPGDDVDEVLRSFLADAPPVRAVGVRVVHGGALFGGPVVVDGAVARTLADLDELAPLHNPQARALMESVRRVLPDIPVVACFDTSFHRTLPEAAAVWAVPWHWTSELGIRRFGFHGLSHQWASRRAAEMLARPVEELRLVVCHLGAGASLAAVDGGRSVDTTMGFTPLDGLVMATRSGAVDPGVLLWVQRHAGLSPDDMEHALDHESGLLALSGRSGDLRDVLAGAEAGDGRCTLALDVYLHRLRAAMAAMAASMGGVDAFVFTGGIGEHSPVVRATALEGLAFLGAGVDRAANAATVGRDGVIGAADAAVAAVVVVAREELSIAAGVRAAFDEAH